jgi:hypothetical protein
MYPRSGGTTLSDPTRANFPFSSVYASSAKKAKQHAAKRALARLRDELRKGTILINQWSSRASAADTSPAATMT